MGHIAISMPLRGALTHLLHNGAEASAKQRSPDALDMLILLMGVPPSGWFLRDNHIKMDDSGVPPIYGTPHMLILLMVCFFCDDNVSAAGIQQLSNCVDHSGTGQCDHAEQTLRCS